ncbi:thiol reductant ABC exporter subunit CydC [Halomonas sp. IOP_31]|uniref:thiol reductant ABC exporter subunit CydC n=1 Tax=Halomonas sp. IOP_31 TaxID=2876584 RepID=UPI001E4F697B|nr:thiol reductant ABC exporter subunit CydC [Halomonas sp. IOP_31]MCD6007830.1 thiol reductant ABC exporter subunit CydC [Halomonas sp. IOP_31]
MTDRGGPTANETWRELRPYLAPLRAHAGLFILGIALNLLAFSASIGLIALSGWFLSATALAGLSAATAFNFYLPSAWIRLFVLVRTAGRYGERLTSHQATLKLLSALRERAYRHIEPLSPAALQRYGSGDLMTRLTADVDALDGLYLRVLMPSIVALWVIVGCGVVIGVFAPGIGLFAATALLASALLGPWLAWRRGQRHSARWQALDAQLRGRLIARLAAFSELLLYGRWTHERDTLLAAQRQRDAEERRLARLWGHSQLLTHTLLGISVTVTLALAAWLVDAGTLDPTLLALMGLAVLAAFEAIAPLPKAMQDLGRLRHAAARLNRLHAELPGVDYPDVDRATPGDARLKVEALRVCFDGIPALDDVTLAIASGEHVALLGATGSGKTTLLNALLRFVAPQRGTLSLGGAALDALSEPSLRQAFAVAPQDVHLFVASYRENLLIAAPEASDATLIELLEALGLGDWLASQPAGLDSYPDEGGSSLSGGQLRRFGVARALLYEAPVVLLDEPTEWLDEASASRVLAEIRRRCRGRTLLLATHRLRELDRFDRIAVLDAGRVLEFDTPQALLADARSRYAALRRRTVIAS